MRVVEEPWLQVEKGVKLKEIRLDRKSGRKPRSDNRYIVLEREIVPEDDINK